MKITKYVNIPLVLGLTAILCVVFYAFSPPPKPVVSLDIPIEIQFGELERNIPASGEIVLTNQSENLIDFKLLGDCECVSFAPAFGTVPPQEKLAINVTFNPVGKDSSELLQDVVQTVHCETMDDGHYASRPINLSGTLFSPLLYDRNATTARGYSYTEWTHSISVSLNKAVRAVSVVSHPDFVANVTIGEINPVFQGLEISIDFKSVSKPQVLSGNLELALVLEASQSNERKTTPVTLPITYEAVSPLTLQPNQLLAMEPGEYRTMLISKINSVAVKFIDIEAISDPQLRATLSLDQKEVAVNVDDTQGKTRMEQIACRVLVTTDTEQSVTSITVPVLILGE